MNDPQPPGWGIWEEVAADIVLDEMNDPGPVGWEILRNVSDGRDRVSARRFVRLSPTIHRVPRWDGRES